MVGILEGLAPGRRGVSEVSEQAERVSMSSEVSEASLPLRLLARLPARLVGPLVEDGVRLVSENNESHYSYHVRNKYNNVHIIKSGRGNQIYFKEVLNNYFINKINIFLLY